MADGGSRMADCENALTEAEIRAKRGPMPLFLAEALLMRARLALQPVAKALPPSGGEEVDSPANRQIREAVSLRNQAAALIAKHGYGRRKPDLAVLDLEIGFTTEEGLIENAVNAVAEGWWFLIPRLEAVRDRMPAPGLRARLDQGLARILALEKAYHEERDAYLKQQAAQPAPGGGSGGGGPVPSALLDALLSQLPREIVQQIAQQTGLPADTAQWPPEVKQQVADLMRQQMKGT